jgi:hypothetical protein
MKRWVQSLFIVLVSVSILGLSVEMVSFRYWVTARQEVTRLFADLSRESVEALTEAHLAEVPEIVKNWLQEADAVGRSRSISVRTRMKFSMAWPQREQWREGIAHLYVNAHEPGFVWMGTSKELPFVRLCGKRVFLADKVEETQPLLSMGRARIVTGEKLREGMMVEFLTFLPWMPAAAVNPYLVWEELGSKQARVTMTLQDTTVEGIFFFRDDGFPGTFRASMPVYENGEYAGRHLSVTYNRYADLKGGRTPRMSLLFWMENDIEKGWMYYEHTDSDYNSRALFSSF